MTTTTHALKAVGAWTFPADDEFMAKELKGDEYQASHLRLALAHVTDWSVAIDGGAHVGTWSRLLAARFARVIAVEPSPDTYEALTINMAHFGCGSVECLQVAVGASAGVVSMAPLEARAAALHNTGARFVQHGGTIPCVTIDSWELPSCGFVKLDIEGSEVDALKGAVNTLARCRPIVLFEDKGFCRRFGYGKDAPQQFLASVAYQHLQDAGCDRIWGPR